MKITAEELSRKAYENLKKEKEKRLSDKKKYLTSKSYKKDIALIEEKIKNSLEVGGYEATIRHSDLSERGVYAVFLVEDLLLKGFHINKDYQSFTIGFL